MSTVYASQVTEGMEVIFPGRVKPVTVLDVSPCGARFSFACESRHGFSVVTLPADAACLPVVTA